MKIDWLTFSQCHCLKSLSKCIYDLIESDIQYKHRTHSNLNLWTFMSKSVTVLCLQRFFFLFYFYYSHNYFVCYSFHKEIQRKTVSKTIVWLDVSAAWNRFWKVFPCQSSLFATYSIKRHLNHIFKDFFKLKSQIYLSFEKCKTLLCYVLYVFELSRILSF